MCKLGRETRVGRLLPARFRWSGLHQKSWLGRRKETESICQAVNQPTELTIRILLACTTNERWKCNSKATCHRPKLPILDITGSSDSIAVMLQEVCFDTRGCFCSGKWKDKQDKARYLQFCSLSAWIILPRLF